jgi:hypothetical protein
MVDRRWKYLVALPALGLLVAALAPGLARWHLGTARRGSMPRGGCGRTSS